MWYFRKPQEECAKVIDWLEQAASKHGVGVRVDQWMEELTPVERKHLEACAVCREAAEDWAVTKDLFREAASFAEEVRPWFPARVMAAIASRERELAERLSAWSEFPRFAARLAWITALLLLACTTWIYERGIAAARRPPSGMAGPESIFEPTAPASQDDVLISMERNP